MSRRPLRLLAAAAAAVTALAVAAVAPAAAAPPEEGVIPGSWIVTLVDGASPGQVADEHARDHGATIDFVYDHALRGYAAHMSEQAMARVARDSRVRTVVADRTVGIDARKPGGGGGTPSAQKLPTGINRIDADLSSVLAGNGSGTATDVDVAVIDTGSGPHGDLDVVGGVNCSSGSSYADGNGHGTHVAGTIGAKDDSAGVVGVAPGARIWSVRVLNNAGSGSWSSVICGINWVTAQAGIIEVANMSLGGTGSEGSCTDGGMHQAICTAVGAGITVAVAAGNETDDAKNHVPASYDEVITVSALADFNGLPGGGAPSTCRSDVDDTFAGFSNYGADVDLIAPGVCINSTWKGGGYSTISGTSMASPHVAGAAALYMVKNPAATPADVLSGLQTAGNTDWNNSDDHDSVKEKLVNVSGF